MLLLEMTSSISSPLSLQASEKTSFSFFFSKASRQTRGPSLSSLQTAVGFPCGLQDPSLFYVSMMFPALSFFWSFAEHPPQTLHEKKTNFLIYVMSPQPFSLRDV